MIRSRCIPGANPHLINLSNTNMENTYIDIADCKGQYERTLERFKNRTDVSDENKELILRFLRDAALGKTVIGRAKKRIGPSRLNGYVIHLSIFITFQNKPIDKLTQEDMEAFVEALDGGAIPSRRRVFEGRKLRVEEGTLSERYRADIKMSVKKFYKWLWGSNKVYPEIVEWIETYHEPVEIPALSKDEIKRMLDRCTTFHQRALIQVLFDGGFRIGELLNVRLHHVRFRRLDSANPEQACFFIHVPHSKTFRRTVALPMRETTRWLSFWLEKHPARPQTGPDGAITADDPNAQLFPMTADAVRSMVRRAGRAALGKRVYPHLLRHSSATYWSNRLAWFKLCKRFGWAMTSSMPQRYIDREGVDEFDVAVQHLRTEAEHEYGEGIAPIARQARTLRQAARHHEWQ